MHVARDLSIAVMLTLGEPSLFRLELGPLAEWKVQLYLCHWCDASSFSWVLCYSWDEYWLCEDLVSIGEETKSTEVAHP